ncbi:uncharacterized protein LOC116167040 [Photinus pyralis]|uniref:uncharacterized protein LOC116167040 n=1 Tax=Photinus pyralis TaxID=7054 RepID=UPI00126762A9|nr:uncharacterized protein LOC116167040 [Photinus pyralis]
MKVFVQLSVICALGLSLQLPPDVLELWEANVAPFLDTCTKEMNVDPEIAKNMFRHVHLPDEQTFHCFMYCIFQKQRFLNSDDELDREQMLETIQTLTPDSLQLCIDGAAGVTDVCVKMYNLTRCIVHDVAE